MQLERTAMYESNFSTRRKFLKNAGAAGAALAGGLVSNGAFSSEGSTNESLGEQCDFSALPADFVYLNSGTEGSMPDCVIGPFRDALNKWASDPTNSYELDPVLGKRQELNRSKAARFLGVDGNNICLTDNTTMGLSMTLMGLNFRPDDRVVITNHEHTAIKSPLQVLHARLGLQIETQAFPPAEVLSRMGSAELLDTLFPNSPALRGAKALCVSHIYPTTGVRLPLSELRKKTEELEISYLIVDGAQALGMIDLTGDENDIKNSDFYACPGHKWLNGPPSTGVLYVDDASIRPPEFYPTISQRMGKYTSCADGSHCSFPIVEALQVRGCSNAPGFAAMTTAMEFAQEAGGAAHIEEHILTLSRDVRHFLLSRAPRSVVSPHSDSALLSGLTTFFPFRWDKPQQIYQDKKTADWVVSELLKKNIQVRSIGFPNSGSVGGPNEEAHVVRVSTGYFNSPIDIDIFKTALQEVLRRIS